MMYKVHRFVYTVEHEIQMCNLVHHTDGFCSFSAFVQKISPLSKPVFFLKIFLKYFIGVNLTERMKIQNISQLELPSRMKLM